MEILDQIQILQKIKRMAIEIYERHAEEKHIILAGINTKGFHVAELLRNEIESLSPLKTDCCHIKLNTLDPIRESISIDIKAPQFKNKVLIITDDVANTGRTLFFACSALMEALPKRVEVAVLVERMHKAFPIHVDYYGLRLATTTKENIDVHLEKGAKWYVQLN
ncbi:MAG: phosphoribosyltransferase [Bacteroidota bacterium]|nr:phosphoribosyltransferase [Bacteroidota bacterium]